MAQGDRSPTEINRNDSFDNTALFSDRVTSRAEVGNLVDRSFEGKLNAFVYPEDLRGTDFARRGGLVMVFKIFTRKSQKIDLTQSLKDAGSLAVEVGQFAAQEIGSVVGIGEGYTDLDQNTNRALEWLVPIKFVRQDNQIISSRNETRFRHRTDKTVSKQDLVQRQRNSMIR